MEKEVRLIQSIQRAFDIINCFSEQSPKLTLPKNQRDAFIKY